MSDKQLTFKELSAEELSRKLEMWDNGYDIFIAHSKKDAQEQLRKMCFLEDTPDDELEGDGWYKMADDYVFILWEDDCVSKSGEKKVSEWIAEQGRGYFAGHNY